MQRIRALAYGFFLRLLLQFHPKPRRNAPTVRVIYKPDAIGDFILSTGVIRQLVNREGPGWLLLCSPSVKPLAEACFPNLDIIAIPGTNIRTPCSSLHRICLQYKICRQFHREDVICLKHSRTGLEQIFLHWLKQEGCYGSVRSPLSTTEPNALPDPISSRSVPYVHERASLPLEVDTHRRVASSYLETPLSDEQVSPWLPPAPNSRSTSSTKKYLTVFPVTRNPLRNLPLATMVKALDRFLYDHPELKLILSGTKKEKATLSALQQHLQHHADIEIRCPSSLLEVRDLIAESLLILSMESAPAHMSICLDRPGVFVIGGGHYEHFAPWGTSRHHIWVTHHMRCFGCNWHCIHKEAYCVSRVTHHQITDSLEIALRQGLSLG